MRRDGIAVAAIVAAVAAGVILAPCQGTTDPQERGHAAVQTSPDWTIAPCAWWADDATPVLPPYTVTDACVTPDGAISVAPGR